MNANAIQRRTSEGGKFFTGFPEYDSLTGYVEKEYTVEWTGRDGTRYRKHVTVINLGRPDRGVPVANPDEQMETERLRDLTQERVKRNPPNHTRDRIADTLRHHGPLPVRRIAELIGIIGQGVTTVITHRDHAGMFARVGKTQGGGGKMADLWGLVGVHDKEAA